MTSARFSLRLDPDLKDWLEDEAKHRDRSAGYVASEAIRALKDATERKDRIIEEALAQADKGVFISEEAITKWFFSLETDNEIPVPKPDVFLKPV
jgi:predicted transcriptional regulator